MGNEPVQLILAIGIALITWTGSVISLVVWLTGKFRALENSFYSELDDRRSHNDAKFEALGTRVQRLEIKNFGFTGPVSVEPRDSRNDNLGNERS